MSTKSDLLSRATNLQILVSALLASQSSSVGSVENTVEDIKNQLETLITTIDSLWTSSQVNIGNINNEITFLLAEINSLTDEDPTPVETLTDIASVDFEDGSFAGLTAAGGEVIRRTGCTATVVADPVDSTKKCAKLTIPGYGASYLFIDRAGVLPNHGRISAEIYIPSGEPLSTTTWWNLFQLKSTVNGSTSSSVPMFNVDVLRSKAYVNYRPDLEFSAGKIRTLLNTTIPRDEWFTLTLEYVVSTTAGKIILYLNGVEIYRDETHPTIMSAVDRVLWSVNNYAGSSSSERVNNPCHVYVSEILLQEVVG